jgi:FkbM family methyltransferase
MNVSHHPIFSKFDFKKQNQTKGFYTDGLGIKTDISFFDLSKWHNKKMHVTDIPLTNDHYFEWISVLTAVYESKSKFTMIELGAGYAPWLIVAAFALKQLNKPQPLLIAVEAEPGRFKWIKKHFKDNNISITDNFFINAAVVPEDFDKSAWFLVGDPAKTYGAALVSDSDFGFRNHRHGVIKKIAKICSRLLNHQRPENVKKVKVSEILAAHQLVDLIDMDIQGIESNIISSSIHLLNEKVRYIHIGTHSIEIELNLRDVFLKNGWINVFDFQLGKIHQTPYGAISFADGVQAWFNPRIKI